MTGNSGGESASNGGLKRRKREDDARGATLRLIERHAAQVMRTARRYAATAEDAEDAYQRAIEIMLTKAPDVPDAELVPWFKTVVRHEAFALRRKDDRIAFGAATRDGAAADEDNFVSLCPSPAEQAERLERLRLGAEALNGLKPQEAQALTLLAQGYSYSQICEETGWTYTKVNRCLAEGRQRFVSRVAGIESGAECERLAPKLSAFADGEAPAADVAVLRRHLRGCLACRTDLRELHLAPALVGALTPLPLLDRLWWPVDRFGELAASLRVKLDPLIRLASESGASPTQFVVSGGARGLGSPGLAKALTILCLGGAGAGGAAAVEKILDPRGPESARASTDSKESSPSRVAEPTSPDARLMAERLRVPDRRSSARERTRSSSDSRATERSPRPTKPTGAPTTDAVSVPRLNASLPNESATPSSTASRPSRESSDERDEDLDARTPDETYSCSDSQSRGTDQPRRGSGESGRDYPDGPAPEGDGHYELGIPDDEDDRVYPDGPAPEGDGHYELGIPEDQHADPDGESGSGCRS